MRPKRRPSAATGLDLVELLARQPDGVGLKELAETANLDPGQAHRILQVLIDAEWVAQAHKTGTYFLTEKLLTVAGRILRLSPLKEAAATVLEDLVAECHETVQLLEIYGDRLVCIDCKVPPQPVAAVLNIGDVVPLENTAVGDAIYAARMLNGAPQDENRDPGILDAARLGYGIADRTYHASVRAVGAAIWRFDGRVIGALSIVGPADRFSANDFEKFGKMVRAASHEISKRLGGGEISARAPGLT